MNILLWILQVVLALHTAVGAIWKFSHSAEQTMPSLKAIPQTVWLTMSGLELLLSVLLILPAIYKPAAPLVPLAAIGIAAEMLLFTVLHVFSGDKNFAPIVYWLIVAVVCAFVAYGRWVLKPL